MVARRNALVFQHNGHTLRVVKVDGGPNPGTAAFMYGNPNYPGGLLLRGYRHGMTRREVKALAMAASDELDEYQRKRRQG